MVSSISWRSSKSVNALDAITSVICDGSSMLLIDFKVSDDTRMLALQNSSNTPCKVRDSAIISLFMILACTLGNVIFASEYFSSTLTSTILARRMPSTKTRNDSPGKLSTCLIFATVPTSYKSLLSGTSTSSSCCATSKMSCSFSIATSSAATLRGCATSKCNTTDGNTVIPFSGKSGMLVYLGIKSSLISPCTAWQLSRYVLQQLF